MGHRGLHARAFVKGHLQNVELVRQLRGGGERLVIPTFLHHQDARRVDAGDQCHGGGRHLGQDRVERSVSRQSSRQFRHADGKVMVGNLCHVALVPRAAWLLNRAGTGDCAAGAVRRIG